MFKTYPTIKRIFGSIIFLLSAANTIWELCIKLQETNMHLLEWYWSLAIGVFGLMLILWAYREDKKRNIELAKYKEMSSEIKLPSLNPNLLKIDNTSNIPLKGSKHLNILRLSYWSIIFLSGLWIISLIVRGMITINSNIEWQWTVFIIIFFGCPVVFGLNVFVWEKNAIKKGESWVIAKNSFSYSANTYEELFTKCVNILISMDTNSSVIEMDRPKLIKVQLGDSIFTMKLKRIRGNTYKIDSISDSIDLTTKFGYRNNKKNINRFKQSLLIEKSMQ